MKRFTLLVCTLYGIGLTVWLGTQLDVARHHVAVTPSPSSSQAVPADLVRFEEDFGSAEWDDQDRVGGRVGGQLIQQPPKTASRRTDLGSNYPNANHRMHYTVLQAFREAIGSQWMATVRVLARGRMVAMGTIVDANGWILTKASELPDDAIEVRLYEGSRVPAKVVARRNDVDLALLKIEKAGLQAVEWANEPSLQVGTWLALTDLKSIPAAIGVISVQPRNIKQERVVVGIGFDWTAKGNQVNMVLPGSGAARAGLEVGDLIVSVDGATLRSRQDLLDKISRAKAGQTIHFDVLREENEVSLEVELMDLNHSLLDPTEMEVNGEVSSRSSGFASAFQHDTVVSPSQCGGPLVDLDGKAVGINIARAGRVTSYALPASLAKQVANEMMAAAKNAPATAQPSRLMRAQDNVIPAR